MLLETTVESVLEKRQKLKSAIDLIGKGRLHKCVCVAIIFRWQLKVKC